MTSADFAWLVEHGTEIFEKYAGKWIAVHDGEVIGIGDTATEAAERANRNTPHGDYLLDAVEADGDAILLSRG